MTEGDRADFMLAVAGWIVLVVLVPAMIWVRAFEVSCGVSTADSLAWWLSVAALAAVGIGLATRRIQLR